MRFWADSGLRGGEDWWRDTVAFPFRKAIHGMLLAMAGKSTEADAEAREAARVAEGGELKGYQGLILHLSSWIEASTGWRDKAIDLLERMLNKPYGVTRAQIAIDPAWTPLRSHSRFQQLIRSESP
jgi:hypothetical protein